MSDPIPSVKIEQEVRAPVMDVFRAFTNSTILREWLCDVATVDPKPGGRIYLWWHSGMYVVGTFNTVETDKEIEFSCKGCREIAPTTTHILLTEKPGRTLINLTLSGFPEGKEGEELHADIGHRWEKSLKNLVSVMEEGPDLRITSRPMLGIILDSFNEEVAKKLGVPVTKGMRLAGVVEGMGAQKAGLKKDDIIVEVDGVPQTEFNDFTTAIHGKVGGDVLNVIFYRGAEKKSLKMELSKRPIPEIPFSGEKLAAKMKATANEVDTELAEIFKGVDDATASHKPDPEEWSAKETLAHLIHSERYFCHWINELVFSAESATDTIGDNLSARIAATVAVYGTVENLLLELKRNEAETIETLRRLPEEFIARRSTFWRMAYWLLTTVEHTRGHYPQIKAALVKR
jgi:uncharacterized protein YndB with AHSA1/START domain